MAPAQATVDAYLPAYAPPHRLDPAHPECWGNVVTQDMFYRHRQAIEAELGALFSPGEGRSGALIGGHPRYFDRPVRCTLLSHRRVDTGTTAYANERRLQCAIRAEIDIVRLYRATLITPNVTTDTLDPNDPPSEEP